MQAGTKRPRGQSPDRKEPFHWPDPNDKLGLRRRHPNDVVAAPPPSPDDTPSPVPHRPKPIACCDGFSHCLDHSRWYLRRLLHKARQSDIEAEPREYFKWVLIELMQATQERRERLNGESTPSRRRRSVDPPNSTTTVTPTVSPPPSRSPKARQPLQRNSPRDDPVESPSRDNTSARLATTTRLTWRDDPPATRSPVWGEVVQMDREPRRSWRYEFQRAFGEVDTNTERVRNESNQIFRDYGKRLLLWMALLLLVLYLLSLEPKPTPKPKRLTPTWVDLTNYV